MVLSCFVFFPFIFISWRLITLQYCSGFCGWRGDQDWEHLYSHVLKNFPQFAVIHTVKGFGIVNKAEVDVFWNSLTFLMIQQMLAI